MSKKRFLTLLTLIIMSLTPIIAQENIVFEEEEDIVPIDTASYDSIVGILPEMLDTVTHKVLEGWHVKYFSRPEEFCEDEDTNPVFSDSTYKRRLERLPFVIPMAYNDKVRRSIDLYSGRYRKTVRYLMGMADYFFPIIEQKLDEYGLPLELKYLAVVESALNPTAHSRVGAYGLWQFMLPTGKIYGLEINSLIDERLDPEKATDAACRYFKEMYDLYGDWLLVLAAYNSGPGNVNKAIRRSGGKTDFWKIFQYLPRETRSYVPLFIAAAYIMTYHCDHNICPIRANFSVATDTFMVERSLHFDQIAEILNIDKEAIRFYNPQYKREIIPGNITPSVLRLPVDKTFAFMDNEDSVYTYRVEELLAECKPVDPNNPDTRKEKITHLVKAGENVYTIANLYGVQAKDLRRWNSLRGSRVPTGRKLTVYVDNGGLTFASTQTSSAPKNESVKTASKPAGTSTAKPVIASTAENGGTYITYKVKSGDSLYEIAKRYPGVSAKNIQDANGLTTTNLRIGQILKIPQG
ncbi:MAG: transglycosylase SLT domain-containing protein [Tannerella sp.]|jgi:membrane-bound lytic murein transglycosylase D|nr:transglycosylase SLT domain-containing protein [Tannerella sp.]